MARIPCSEVDPFEIGSLEAAAARRREQLKWTWGTVSVLLAVTALWLVNAFVLYPALKAERFEFLNRSREEKVGDPDVANTSVPIQADKSQALLAAALVVGLTAAAIAFSARGRVPQVAHRPGDIEESVRPDYGRAQISVVRPRAIRMYFVRCRDCGKTLRQWERRE